MLYLQMEKLPDFTEVHNSNLRKSRYKNVKKTSRNAFITLLLSHL